MLSEITKDEPVYPIRTAANLLKISVHTLRMYEKEKLILPYKKSTSHRLYSESDIDRIKCIRTAINELKISINGIKTIYSMMPCWEIMQCGKEEKNKCGAFTNHNGPCWAVKGEDTVCAAKNCRNCKVYSDFSDCNNIKEYIKKLKS